MRTSLALVVLLITFSSCGVFNSLNSNTSIKPKDSFVLGNNKQGVFKAYLINEGSTELKVYKAPIEGGTHSPILLHPKESITVKTEKNTALIIENKGDVYGTVTLKVRGDLNLGMNYNN